MARNLTGSEHHAAAADHYDQAAAHHRQASRHYAEKDRVRGAHQALLAHGHAQQAGRHMNAATKCHLDDVGESSPAEEGPLKSAA